MKIYLASGGSYSDYSVCAAFATKEAAEAFVDHPDTYASDVEEYELYEGVPGRIRWYVIEQYPGKEVTRRDELRWEFEGPPPYYGYRRKGANFHRLENVGRAFGQDKAAVEKMWKEVHAAEEALEAGV